MEGSGGRAERRGDEADVAGAGAEFEHPCAAANLATPKSPLYNPAQSFKRDVSQSRFPQGKWARLLFEERLAETERSAPDRDAAPLVPYLAYRFPGVSFTDGPASETLGGSFSEDCT